MADCTAVFGPTNYYSKTRPSNGTGYIAGGDSKDLTINVPLIFKVRDIIFLRSGQFRGQKGLGSLEKPQEMPQYMFCHRQKNNFQDFQNQRYIGIIDKH
jgi:hypothetical protein